MKIVDPRHLLQFHEIIRTGSFTRAAETLGLTQPALTRNMKLMEGRLGFELLVRSRQGIVATSIGLRILEEANMVVLAEQRIARLTDSLRQGYDSEVRVGCTSSIGLHILPEPLTKFAQSHPHIRLDIRQGHTNQLVSMLGDKEVDVVLGPIEISPANDLLSAAHFFDTRLVILASRRHPLATKARVTRDDLLSQRWALYRRDTMVRAASDRLLRQIGIDGPIEAMELPSNIIAALLQLGEHLAIMPDYLLHRSEMSRDLVEIRMSGVDKKLAMGALWHQDTPADPNLQAFIEIMKLSLSTYHSS
ncbi:LysR family transcriptional regulator [Alphaproteobacteria bacterium]|nr:LysR family transcriptional regulator [Alphaproteobacteria bacterium]